MKYLKVVNRGTVHRKFLELVGFSTKRDQADNLSIIGSKGSGSKLLVPAALRLGLKVFVCSSDEEGDYMLSYETKKTKLGEAEVSQIYFVYGEDNCVPAQFILESFGDWDKPIGADTAKEFKVVREILANARDADPDFHWDIVSSEEKDGFSYNPEETTVFVSLTPGIEEMLQNNSGRYFKFLGTGYHFSVPGIGDVYPKSSPITRIFVMGILAECTPGDFFDSTLFDYSVDGKNILSEERTIKDGTELRRKIAELLTSVDSVAFSKLVIRGIVSGNAGFENSCLSYISDDTPAEDLAAYLRAWLEMEEFGEKAVIAATGEDAKLLNEDAKYRGYKVKYISHSGLLRLLSKAGVRCVSDVVTRRLGEDSIVIVEPTERESRILYCAITVLRHNMPEADSYPVRIFTIDDPRTKWDGLAGFGETNFKEMLVNRNAFKKGMPYVLRILAHELRHCMSGAQDYTPEFELQADEDEAKMMLRAYVAHRRRNKK